LESLPTKGRALRTARLIATAIVTIVTISMANEPFTRAQSPQTWVAPKVSVPEESVGIDGIVRTLISAFDQADIVALGEAHGSFPLESDLRIALVRNPDFAIKVRAIVVEFGSTTEQSTLDRYIRGEKVSPDQLAQVWKTTTQAANGNDIWDSPVYPAFFAAVRDVNSRLSADQQIHVFGGDPGPGDNRSRETAAVAVIKQQVLEKHGKALVIYGAAHFYRTLSKDYLASMGGDIGIVNMLDIDYPSRTFVVIPLGWLERPRPVAVDVPPDYKKFDRGLKTQMRPVMISLERLPFRNFTVEEFLGRTVTSCRGPDGCMSAFRGSTLTLSRMADAAIYYGGNSTAETRAIPVR
jgi:hypothetical protein